MPHQWARLNLAAAEFPFATPLWGRSIMIPGLDENYEKSIVSPRDQSKDKGVPQAFYMHNCMPTGTGYQAVGYDTQAAAFSPAVTDFDQAFPLQNSNLNHFVFVPAGGKNYVFDRDPNAWRSISPITPGTFVDPPMVTTAFVQGQTYVCYQRYGVFKYNEATKAMDPVAFTGLVTTAIDGICAANGYMIAWDQTAVYNSSATNPTLFSPSLATGAAARGIQDAKGKIICCLSISGGFIIYCAENAVGATYTGNINFPWAFLEIPKSGGITGPEQVSWQANEDVHYVWSSNGLQEYALKGAASSNYPELTQFITGQIFEDFNETTLTFSETVLAVPLSTKLTIVEATYMVLSYGVVEGVYTHALVLDLSLGRWGKVKLTHVDVFQWNTPNYYLGLPWSGLEPKTWADLEPLTWGDLGKIQTPVKKARKTVAFLQNDGTVKTMNFNVAETNDSGTVANGILILGKFQIARNYFIVTQQFDVENVTSGQSFGFYLLPSLDGKTFLPAVTPRLIRTSAKSRRYAHKLSAMNVSFVYTGAFYATSLLANFTQGGQR